MSGPVSGLLAVELPTAQDTRGFGTRLAALLRAGDLLVLAGGLGAGKTTLTQGIGAGLGVRGAVTSPTFVIARVHPSLVGGPPLVHVDAYRLGGVLELDDLDLDESLEQAVTVVEWGEGLAEGLADSWLEVRLERRADGGAAPALAAAGSGRDAVDGGRFDESRAVSVRTHGPRWAGVPLRSSLT